MRRHQFGLVTVLTFRHASTTSKVNGCKLALPTMQSHLRIAKKEEDVLKHNAFNLVMKLLYGKISQSPELEKAHPILGVPEANSKIQDRLCLRDGFRHSSIDNAGVFAKLFIRQQKEIWHQYNQAVQKARSNSLKATSRRSIYDAPSNISSKLYRKRSANAQRRSLRQNEVVSVLDVSLSEEERELLKALEPPRSLSHASKGCNMSNYVSFMDMLTYHGKLFKTADSTEDLFVASSFATTNSQTMSAKRQAAMRRHYQAGTPATRYLYAPPGMLVRGYSPVQNAKGDHKIILEPEDSWIDRCKADILNFERFCLAKVSTIALRNLNAHSSVAEGLLSSRSLKLRRSPEVINIMDLFLAYRGLPTGSMPRSKAVNALRKSQEVADKVTWLYNSAMSEIDLPLGSEDGLPVSQLDSVIQAAPPTDLLTQLGLCSPTAGHDTEISALMSAFKQNTMLLRRQSHEFSPSVVPQRASPSAQHNVQQIVNESLEKGVNVYDLVSKMRGSR